ncbi:hypothetical protein PLESTB_001831100 [Pleodorina starrii]|uniref:Cation efflux protein transmembrane domain-containing protein n=1 Tax=Pleodorina starrii TaxID=330485 RepID=A0A9W6FA76_9CHLO|nr:hypothetical protein PLESTB_001831100 [Pleodorina starrii]
MSLDAAPFATPHEHVYLGSNHARNEKRTWLVIAITAAMMVIEITAGSIYGSMALVADGWHMSTHAGAMLIAALAYRYARRNLANRRFTFGTGKMGDLAGFASAVVLALVALLIGWESLMRLYSPVAIDFQQAIIVAVIGLALGPGQHAAIAVIRSASPLSLTAYRAKLAHIHDLSHMTIEIEGPWVSPELNR